VKRYKKLLIALAAVLSLVIARETGLDRGLIDDVLDAAVEAIVDEPESAPEPTSPEFGGSAESSPRSAEVPKDHFANPERCSDCHK
jgi:hypothetical protein